MEARDGLLDREPGELPNDGRVRAAPVAIRRVRETEAAAALAFVGLFAVALAIQLYVARTLDGPAAPDAASSVLYFQRIVAGRHLEAFVNTTPKPLLTIVYGALFTLTHDWRLISLAAAAAAGSAAVLGAELARRLGGLAAGAFAFVALAGLESLLREVTWAYGLPWAVALWLAASLALVRERPRYRLAGLFLLLAALARPETFIVLGLATLAIGAAWVRNRPAARAALPLLVGWLALVGMGIHDWLLIGDPLWWTSVAATHAAAVPGQRTSVGGVLREAFDRTRALGLTAILAVIGTALLFMRRQWVLLVGLVALGPLVVLEDAFFAWRGLEVLGHYLNPIDIVAVIAASVAVGAGVDAGVAALRNRGPSTVVAIAVVAAAAVLAVAITPFAPLSSGARTSLGRQAELAVHETRVLPALDCGIGRPVASGCVVSPAADRLRLYLPSLQLIRFVVDLDIPVTRAATLDLARLRQGPGYPPAGSLVHLDPKADIPAVEQYSASLRVTSPTDVGGVRLVPLLADPTDGLWVVRVDPPSGS